MYRIIPAPPPPEEGDEINLMRPIEVAKLLHVDRHVVLRAMKQYSATNGRNGLAFVSLTGRQRLVRRASIADWLAREEELAAMGYI